MINNNNNEKDNYSNLNRPKYFDKSYESQIRLERSILESNKLLQTKKKAETPQKI
jgi:hypothetical protein